MDLTSLTSSIINIPLSKHVHNHTIGCTAINSLGVTNTSIRLLVRCRQELNSLSFWFYFISLFLIDPPSFIIRPPKLVVLDLDSKSSLNSPIIRCIVDSYPRAKITWYRYGEIIAEGSSFNLENITKRDQQGTYSTRIETDGFETITHDFIIYIKGISTRDGQSSPGPGPGGKNF